MPLMLDRKAGNDDVGCCCKGAIPIGPILGGSSVL